MVCSKKVIRSNSAGKLFKKEHCRPILSTKVLMSRPVKRRVSATVSLFAVSFLVIVDRLSIILVSQCSLSMIHGETIFLI